MDSEEEVEAFEITDHDLESELYPGRRHMQTRAEAIYGVWATSDDDEEVGGGYQRKTRKKMQDYAQPMGFVSGGLFHDDDEEEEKQSGNEKFADDENEVAPINKEAGKGGFVTSSRNDSKTLKQEPIKKKERDYESARFKKNTRKFGAWEKYNTGFGSRMLEKMGYKGKGLGKDGSGIVEPVQAFKRSGRAAVGAYGSEKAEVSEPVYDTDEEEEKEIKKEIEKLHQWKKTGQETKKPKYVYKTADEVKKSGTSKKLAPLLSYGNVKVVDMTGPETKVLSGYGSLGHQHAKPDAAETHPGIHQEETKAFELPELVYNLNLLVDLAESEIIQIDRQLRFENDNVVNMSHEFNRLENICLEEEVEIDNLEHVLKIIDRCKAGLQPDSDEVLTLEGLIQCFQTLQEKFYEEYKMYDLEKLVIPLGFPLLSRHFATWQPFVYPAYGIEVVKLWRQVLEENKSEYDVGRDGNRSMGPFERLIWEVWMPHLRTAISRWLPKESDALIAIMEAWVQLLPEWIVANILDQLVMPKLQAAVENWDPLTDPTPIHSWLHPWLPLMGDRLEPLYAPIRQKLSSALNSWYPSDPSAKVILEPWLKVFSKGTMEAFLLRSIYPKLEQCMVEFKINPHQQLLEPFHWVMSWKDTISVHHMVSILDKHFFPKWLQVLRKWLSITPNYDEVTKWPLFLVSLKCCSKKQHVQEAMCDNNFRVRIYVETTRERCVVTGLSKNASVSSLKERIEELVDRLNNLNGSFRYLGWKSMFSEEYTNNPTIKEHFNRALLLMNQAVSGALQPGAKENVAYLTNTERRREAEHAALKSEKAQVSVSNAGGVPTRFKDLVEQAAQDNGILFIPLPNRRHEGKSIYSFGRCVIYIDRDVVFYSTEGKWKPASLQDLLDMSRFVSGWAYNRKKVERRVNNICGGEKSLLRGEYLLLDRPVF